MPNPDPPRIRQLRDDLDKLRAEVLQQHAASLEVWRDLVKRCGKLEDQIQQYERQQNERR